MVVALRGGMALHIHGVQKCNPQGDGAMSLDGKIPLCSWIHESAPIIKLSSNPLYSRVTFLYPARGIIEYVSSYVGVSLAHRLHFCNPQSGSR